MTTTIDGRPSEDGFLHDALFYAGPGGFVNRTAPFIRDAVDADEPILVVVGAEKIDMLRSELDGHANKVRFADMADVGQNPARIIPAWHEFVAEHAGSGRRFRGIGEPISQSRSADELVECERHEALLNLAFAGPPAWWLACPYDVEALEPAVIEQAQRNHPFVVDEGARRASAAFSGLSEVAEPFDDPLPEPPVPSRETTFSADDLRAVRAFVARGAADFGLSSAQTKDLVLAADEIATNSVRHGGGRGFLRIWSNGDTVSCEVRDAGRIDDPLVGRWPPAPDQTSGFGLWLANQLCDLVQVRTSEGDGSVVRLHISHR